MQAIKQKNMGYPCHFKHFMPMLDKEDGSDFGRND